MISVLHVDDEPAILDITAEFLRREADRIEVYTAEGAEAALDVLDRESIECVVCDYRLPKTDGMALLEQIRERYPHLPFILFTGQGSAEIASEAIRAGVTDYLQKGTDPSQYAVLANRIVNAVEQYRSRAALEAYDERMDVLLADSHDIITVVDRQGRIQYVSPAVGRILGYEPGDLVGEVMATYVHPDDVDAFEALVGDGPEDEICRREYRLRSVDGSWRWVESIGRNQWRDVVEGFVLNTRDVTERRSTRRRFRALLDQSTDVVTVIDANGTIEYTSRSLETHTGFDPDAVIGDNAFQYVHPADREAVWAAFETLLDDPAASPVIEHRFATRDGSWRWFETTGNNQLENPGIEGVVVNARDVTARKRESRKVGRYETLLAELPVGVCVLDEDATIEWVNEAFRTAVDATETEVAGTPFTDLVDRGLLDADIVDTYLEAVRTLLSSETDADSVKNDFQMSPPEGEVPREYEGYIALRRLVDGEFRGTVNAFLDVTERRRHRRELEQYKAAMETVPDGVFLLDEEGVLMTVNRAMANTVGYDREQLEGEPFQRLVEAGIVDQQVVDTYLDLVDDLLASDYDWPRETFLTQLVPPTDDREHVFEVHVGLLPQEDGFQGTASVVRDVTERVDRQRALEAENERLDEFASIVGHDLRNPLNVVMGSLDQIEVTGDPKHLERCRTGVDRMERLIDDLLELARQGRDVGQMEPVDLASVVETCWEAIETHRTTLRIETDATLVADRPRLEQLVENLLVNAIEHGGETATITIGDLDDADGFYVADDGQGVASADRTRVFESGYSTAADGTGLGLHIVEGIADAHGWSIDLVESENGGARFEFETGGAAA